MWEEGNGWLQHKNCYNDIYNFTLTVSHLPGFWPHKPIKFCRLNLILKASLSVFLVERVWCSYKFSRHRSGLILTPANVTSSRLSDKTWTGWSITFSISIQHSLSWWPEEKKSLLLAKVARSTPWQAERVKSGWTTRELYPKHCDNQFDKSTTSRWLQYNISPREKNFTWSVRANIDHDRLTTEVIHYGLWKGCLENGVLKVSTMALWDSPNAPGPWRWWRDCERCQWWLWRWMSVRRANSEPWGVCCLSLAHHLQISTHMLQLLYHKVQESLFNILLSNLKMRFNLHTPASTVGFMNLYTVWVRSSYFWVISAVFKSL